MLFLHTEKVIQKQQDKMKKLGSREQNDNDDDDDIGIDMNDDN